MAEQTPTQDDFTGKTVGAYQIQAAIGQSRWGTIYRAMQTTVHRTVALKILSPEIAALPGKVEHFLEESRATAQLSHQNIVSIFEAGRADGVFFRAMEYMDGPLLPEFLREGHSVNEQHLLQAIAGIAHALGFLWQRKVLHQPPAARNILISSEGTPKLINIEPTDAAPSQSPQEDILALGLALAHISNEIAAVSKPVAELVERMMVAHDRKPFDSLADLAHAAEGLERQLFPPPPPPTRLTVEKMQAKRKPVVIVILVAGLLAVIAAVVVIKWREAVKLYGPARPSDFGTMVEVRDGATPFWIDRYEVTIGDYKRFLDAIAAGAGVQPHAYAPARKDYRPTNWDLMLDAIKNGQPFNDQRLTWDSPVFGIDWYDAHAYASWRGKRLPTEQEWERAAQGAPSTVKAGKWAVVYADASDRSALGVVGMAGNVSEWTAIGPDRDLALVRGGSWKDANPSVDVHPAPVNRLTRMDTLGFRCAAGKEVKP